MTIEVTAKKPEDAIKQGLEQLGATLDEVTVEVLESGGLFRKAKVRLTLEREETPAEKPEKESDKPVEKAPADKPEKPAKQQPEKVEKSAPVKPEKTEKADKPEKKASAEKAEKAEKPAKKAAPTKPEKADKQEKTEKADKPEKVEKVEKTPKHTKEEEKQALSHACEFVKAVVDKMGFEAAVSLNDENGMIEIDAPAGDDALLIGRHGETLSALSYIAETAERAEKYRIGVTVDCNGYRGRRAANLTAMARRRADECVNKHRRIKLEAMDRTDRRTIHFALADDDRVTTASEGKEPHRYIVICPKKKS
ncbi:MAG: KH domain-containing protein [Clostridiales bacterium]|nr:KH domain-containing protein [Clostridiales bacterium]